MAFVRNLVRACSAALLAQPGDFRVDSIHVESRRVVAQEEDAPFCLDPAATTDNNRRAKVGQHKERMRSQPFEESQGLGRRDALVNKRGASLSKVDGLGRSISNFTGKKGRRPKSTPTPSPTTWRLSEQITS
jgi:hypothetical protein